MKKIYVSLLLILVVFTINAQPILLGNNSAPSVTGCSFTIYDYGGLDGNYAPNRDDQITITSNDPSFHSVQINLDLLSFDVDCSDTLFIYNGPTASAANLLAVFTNCITDSMVSPSVSYAATIQNASGSITIRFKTNGSGEGAGFVITTECTRPCQRVEVAFDTANSTKIPKRDTDGYYYIDLCPDEELHLKAYGIYPDNDYSYHQSDATSSFLWDLGWEYIDSVGYDELVYTFSEGHGYDVSVSITDEAGCYSFIPQIFRVRTSTNPIRKVKDMPDVCAGTEFSIPVGYDFISALQVDTVGSIQETSLSVSDTIYLPDGIMCGNPPSCSYVSPVTFTSFSPTATIQSPNDILFVRIKLEHSYIGDIWIKLTCPNQQYVSIMKKYDAGYSPCTGSIPDSEKGWNGTGNSASAYFGDPVDDYSSASCTPGEMGTCWNYCWSNATNQGYQYNSNDYVYKSGSVHGNRVDSTNVANMTNVYHPDGSFANLIGCPMNGVWSIEILDGYSQDNGFVCGWEIALDPNLLPQDWSYEAVLDSSWVVGPGAHGTTIIPDTAGNVQYNVFIKDDLGCVYDTLVNMKVIPNPQPQIGSDYNICAGDVTVLNPNYNTDSIPELVTKYYWSTGDETETIEAISAGDYTVTCYTTSLITGLECQGSDTINIGIFESPKLDFNAPQISGCAPLNLKIENNSTPADSYYEWYLVTYDMYGNENVAYSSTQYSPTFNIKNPGVYSLLVKATTQDGCKDSVALWNYISVNEQPIAEFDADPEVSLISESMGVVSFINHANTPESSTWSYHWDFGDGSSDSSHTPTPHTYTSWGDYDVVLHVSSTDGCSSEVAHTIVIEQDLIFPNVITPNGDNINDVFAIENLNTNINEEDPDGYRNNHLKIHDRWGKKVYDAKNYDTYAKDGQVYPGNKVFDGSGLQDGVYYYSFQYKGKAKTITFNGSITIIRQ